MSRTDSTTTSWRAGTLAALFAFSLTTEIAKAEQVLLQRGPTGRMGKGAAGIALRERTALRRRPRIPSRFTSQRANNAAGPLVS